MKKKTGYLLCRIGMEYNDEGYDATEGVEPHFVYMDKAKALKAKREATIKLALSDSSIGEYCASIDEGGLQGLHESFPDVFDEYGVLKSTSGTGYRRNYVKVPQGAAEYIADHFGIFTIQEIAVYE